MVGTDMKGVTFLVKLFKERCCGENRDVQHVVMLSVMLFMAVCQFSAFASKWVTLFRVSGSVGRVVFYIFVCVSMHSICHLSSQVIKLYVSATVNEECCQVVSIFNRAVK